jgi:hypothetical protein
LPLERTFSQKQSRKTFNSQSSEFPKVSSDQLHLLQQTYATTRRLHLREVVEDLTWIPSPNSSGVLPLCDALDRFLLGTDDVVEIIEYLVGQNPALLCSRDEDGSLPLHVACRRGASFTIVQSLVNLYKASAKTVTSQGDFPLFLACELPSVRKRQARKERVLVYSCPDRLGLSPSAHVDLKARCRR